MNNNNNQCQVFVYCDNVSNDDMSSCCKSMDRYYGAVVGGVNCLFCAKCPGLFWILYSAWSACEYCWCNYSAISPGGTLGTLHITRRISKCLTHNVSGLDPLTLSSRRFSDSIPWKPTRYPLSHHPSTECGNMRPPLLLGMPWYHILPV